MAQRPVADRAIVPTWAAVARLPSSNALKASLCGRDLGLPDGRDTPRLMTVSEVAAGARVSTKTVRRLINSGKLRVVRIGRAIRIPAAEYLRLIGSV